jgi:hypothetical protein
VNNNPSLLGVGSATFPDASLASGSTNGPGNWLLSAEPVNGNLTQPWWWRDLTGGSITINVTVVAGVSGDIIVN